MSRPERPERRVTTSAPVVVARAAGVTRREGRLVARLTRAAYHGSDPIGGLPVPDGARERTDDVLRAAAIGDVWLAYIGDEIVGAGRTAAAAGGWGIGRLAVHPSARGRGVGAAIVDAIGTAAAAADVAALQLNAVVERGLPQYYAELGFAVQHRFPASDKPMTEVSMRRPAGARVDAVAWPWAGDDAFRPGMHTVTWWRRGDQLDVHIDDGPPRSAIAARHRDLGEQSRLAGADEWRLDDDSSVRRLWMVLGARPYDIRRPPVAFRMPRRLDRDARAVCRFPAGVRVPENLR